MRQDLPVMVWIVEDQVGERNSFQAILEIKGVVIRDYRSPREFLADFKPDGASCFLLDESIADLSRVELLCLLRKQGIRLPIIVLTSAGKEALMKRITTGRSKTMLTAPIDAKSLAALITDLRKKH